ncbi:MAG: hypothetical protein U1D30_15330 [Planctomycetota bacterium]
MQIQIWDDSKEYRSIEITEVVLQYKDGQTVRTTDAWSRQLVLHTQYNSSSSGILQTEMFMLSDEIEGLAIRHADVRITLKGCLTRENGERVSFETSESFKPESRSNVTTFWKAMANC